MSFDLRHLEGFVAVAEELHFGRAAARLHIAQPALSQQIQKLEASLGVDLLVREHRRTRLSDAGEAFLVEARRTLTHADLARAVARRAGRGELGRLRVGYVPTASSRLFLGVLAGFRRRCPEVELDVRELTLGLLASPLQDNVVDVAFIARLGEITCLGPDTAYRKLSAEHFVAAVPASHPMASRSAIELSELAEEDFVLLAPDVCEEWHNAILSVCGRAGFTPRVSHHTREVSTQLLSVAAELGVALVPASAHVLRGDDVAFIPLTGAGPQITSAILWRASDNSPVLHRFIRDIEKVRPVQSTSTPRSAVR
jgi:DNA-binding transcriptional LysR family regulator